ncbi:hypothetical protein QBC37DRAFT_444034 [Rhypophila decipiens]|uniref:Secreted protein n=1 Tax=Rhypophila decipiens TaxID=261697 RepID=A0AAN6Y148_9PEZI|nr:hypothetical protein QBC37DRAFT_444034 [Rhypophila decipiens]
MRAALVSFLAVIMAQITLAVESPIAGYTVVDIQWDIEVAPGQREILNGTVQEIYSQALELNPDFEIKPVAPILSARSRIDRRWVNCNNWPLGNGERLQSGINYLRGVRGRPTNGPGPGNCGQVSCSWGSSIWWCNDNSTPKTLDSFNAIANSAQYILQVCPSGDGLGEYSGQNFEQGNWNTIIRGQSNC